MQGVAAHHPKGRCPPLERSRAQRRSNFAAQPNERARNHCAHRGRDMGALEHSRRRYRALDSTIPSKFQRRSPWTSGISRAVCATSSKFSAIEREPHQLQITSPHAKSAKTPSYSAACPKLGGVPRQSGDKGQSRPHSANRHIRHRPAPKLPPPAPTSSMRHRLPSLFPRRLGAFVTERLVLSSSARAGAGAPERRTLQHRKGGLPVAVSGDTRRSATSTDPLGLASLLRKGPTPRPRLHFRPHLTQDSERKRWPQGHS